jgi:hypothetical protein
MVVGADATPGERLEREAKSGCRRAVASPCTHEPAKSRTNCTRVAIKSNPKDDLIQRDDSI